MTKKTINKEPHAGTYNFIKPVLKVLFMAYYRPKYVNAEVFPKEGPIIVCGNHIHVLDQCLPAFKTKRMLHYMAKKEYFDSKFAWFFKVAGCISVDRKIHDDLAKSKAIDVLNDGLALGIFPEGTRNQISSKEEELKKLYKLFKDEYTLKQFKKIMKKNQVRLTQVELLEKLKDEKKITKNEYKEYVLDANASLKKLENEKIITKEEFKESLLLPLKFGAVSMAEKTGATLVPYAITGHYRFFKNNLKCEFGKPIKVKKGDDLEKLNKKLRDEMLEGLYKGN